MVFFVLPNYTNILFKTVFGVKNTKYSLIKYICYGETYQMAQMYDISYCISK